MLFMLFLADKSVLGFFLEKDWDLLTFSEGHVQTIQVQWMLRLLNEACGRICARTILLIFRILGGRRTKISCLKIILIVPFAHCVHYWLRYGLGALRFFFLKAYTLFTKEISNNQRKNKYMQSLNDLSKFNIYNMFSRFQLTWTHYLLEIHYWVFFFILDIDISGVLFIMSW